MDRTTSFFIIIKQWFFRVLDSARNRSLRDRSIGLGEKHLTFRNQKVPSMFARSNNSLVRGLHIWFKIVFSERSAIIYESILSDNWFCGLLPVKQGCVGAVGKTVSCVV